MGPVLNVGRCRACGYGMLEVVYDFEIKKCHIECDECMAQWENPEKALQYIDGFRKSYDRVVARSATLEEIKAAGWEKYLRD